MTVVQASIEVLSGAGCAAVLDDLAALRIRVFREYPYLYEGSVEYERRYLQSYTRSPGSTLVVARDGEQIVGASTAMPLLQHSDDVVPPLSAAGFDPQRIYYFGESVLLADYRGHGLGHRFFDEREAAARRHGYAITTFCAVVRPDDHPAKPAAYVPHDAFWTKRGYTKRPDIVGHFAWRDIGDAHETSKPMVFWIKELGS